MLLLDLGHVSCTCGIEGGLLKLLLELFHFLQQFLVVFLGAVNLLLENLLSMRDVPEVGDLLLQLYRHVFLRWRLWLGDVLHQFLHWSW